MLTSIEKQRILEELAGRNGGVLRVEDVVREAADPQHPLHAEFDWDDASAAMAHRLEQARALIRSVRVEIRTSTRTILAPYYIRDPAAAAHESGYVPVLRVRTDAELAARALIAELSRAAALVKRARDIAIVFGLESTTDEILTKLVEMAETVSSTYSHEAESAVSA